MLLAHGGHLACVVGLPDLDRLEAFTKAVSIHEIAMGSAHLSGSRKAQTDLAVMGEELIAMVQKGSLSTLLTETIDLADVPLALSRLSRRHVRKHQLWKNILQLWIKRWLYRIRTRRNAG